MTHLFDHTEEIFSSMDFSSLKKEIFQVGRELTYPEGTVIRPKENEILILSSGQMTTSATQNQELVIGHTFPLMPIGLLERYFKLRIYYQAEVTTTLFQLTDEEFDRIFYRNPGHAEKLSQLLLFLSSRLLHIYHERNNDSGYATIRQMLYRYLYKNEEGSVNNEGVASFILKRTHLSRSYIFQILSGLKAGGYITVKNGKLTSINRDIPKRF
ncbi:helix-turn-helix domain-containing protein [Klebsiella aerogenes]|uniref:helix-turn-helix domain-containing protein n=1 Tax=Klebsiella aerogenes TaxID=548 RepID=UPI002DBA9E76|nr:helix-turn-helix domain-containing protein [Klebsiella aerogenes]MEB5841906.1 helix-turn-helix domain-containing protein [Klebsiella aerogenes]MEB5895911.1 helix-turn-helix domain-containing protein [Klebsiella aerogenes]HCM6912104.1 helix-turn-helix domain-containing protein [Klebsiella aerogenes]